MDYALARAKMIESQIRPNGVTDERVIAAMATLPREDFVPPAQRVLAYMDEDIAIGTIQPDGSGRYLIEPMTFARLAQLLDLNPGHKILDVGCGTGYSTAVFATLGNNVIGLESDPALANKARQALARLGLVNLTVVTGEFAEGYPAEAPFDAICVNGSIPEPPLALLAQLKNPGRLAAVVGRYEVGQVAIFTRDGGFSLRYAFDASVPRLPGFDSDKAPFHFERPKL